MKVSALLAALLVAHAASAGDAATGNETVWRRWLYEHLIRAPMPEHPRGRGPEGSSDGDASSQRSSDPASWNEEPAEAKDAEGEEASGSWGAFGFSGWWSFVGGEEGKAQLHSARWQFWGWFSTAEESGLFRREGGWILYLVDRVGVKFFGALWPHVGSATVILILAALVALASYVFNMATAPCRSWLGFLAPFCRRREATAEEREAERLLPPPVQAPAEVEWHGPKH